MIRCGNCGNRHGSVDQVKDCYADTEWATQQVTSDHEAEVRLERRLESPEFYGIPARG